MLLYVLQVGGLLTFHDNFVISKYLFGNLYEGVPVADVSFDDKVDYIKKGTTDGLVIALIVGGILMVWRSFHDETIYLAIVALLALSFLIYFLPEGLFVRSRFLIPFASLVIAGGANAIIVLCENQFKRIFNLHENINYVRLFGIVVVLIIFIPLLYDSTNPFRNKLDDTAKGNQVFAMFSTSEYEAGKWLRQNVPYNTLVVSDPFSINLMTELSDLKPPYKRIWIEPREYPVESLRIMSDIRTKFFLGDNNEDRRAFLNKIMIDNNVTSVIIIVNSRTIKWTNSDELIYVTYSGLPDMQVSVIQKLINQFPAKLIYTDQKTTFMYKYDLSS